MPSVKIVEALEFGGVDARSNPLAFRPNRSLRCLNWCPQASGMLKQRYGYSVPIVTGTVNGVIHSAFYFESVGDATQGIPNTQAVLFGAGSLLYQLSEGVTTSTVAQVATLTDSKPWSAFIANNKIFISDGASQLMTDGTTIRPSGIRAPSSGETASITVVESAGGGSWTPTTLTSASVGIVPGYQFFMSYYNTITGHIGNRSPIGARLSIVGTQSQVVISNLPNLSGVNSEWVKLLGRTADGAQVPYALADPVTGVFVVAGNTATVATLTQQFVDFNSELPTRNGLPPSMHKTCYALGRAYGIDDSDPHLIDYSESESDLFGAASFVGRPEESWSALSQIPFPQNETARCIQEYGNEAWVWSRNFVTILTELGNYSPDGVPNPYFRGTWVGGCCGQRAFVKTPYGPFWLSPQKQLMTYGPSGPISASKEYEESLLAGISEANMEFVELGYHRDPTREIDRIYVMLK